MKVIQSNFALSLIVSGLYLTGCSSSSSPITAATPSNDGADPSVTQDEPATVDDMAETPVTSNPETPVNPGGGIVNTPLTGTISMLGTLNLSHEEFENVTDISGLFFNFNAQITAAQLLAGLEGEMLASDICEVTDLAFDVDLDDIDFDALMPGSDFTPTTISAGEVITLTSPVGTFASLVPSEAFGFLIYGTPDNLEVSGSIPSGLTADIPGAANGFPAFSNVPVPQADSLALTIEGDADSGYSLMWNGSDANNSALSVTFTALDQGSNDFSSQVIISCSLRDDGSQPIPANLLPTGSNVIVLGGSARRTNVNFVQQGNALLMVTSSSDTFVSATELR